MVTKGAAPCARSRSKANRTPSTALTGALCGLAYLAIITRSLGLKGFGHFSLIFGTAQALIWIVGFQSWRTVVRYGAPYVHAKDWLAFGRLNHVLGLDSVCVLPSPQGS